MSITPPASSRGPPARRPVRRRDHRQRVARQPPVPVVRVRRRVARGVRGGPADGPFGEVLAAPLDPLPAGTAAAPPHGAGPRSFDAAVAWVAEARSRLGRGQRPGHRLREPVDGGTGNPSVAGLVAHVPRARAGRPLPRRSRWPGHHHRDRARPVSGAGHRRGRRRSSSSGGGSTSSSPKAAATGRPAPRRQTSPRSAMRSRAVEAGALLDPAGLGHVHGSRVGSGAGMTAPARPRAGHARPYGYRDACGRGRELRSWSACPAL